jgi:hypothetical protein
MIKPITLEELREDWPKDESGRIAADLLQRYGFTLLVRSTVSADCNAVSAQSEAGASKAIAKMVEDFGQLTVKPTPKPPMKPLATLNRNRNPQETHEQK